jgi:hypothetical protein
VSTTRQPNFHLAIWRMWRDAAIECGQIPESWNDYQHRNRKPRTAEGRRKQQEALDRIYGAIAKGASCDAPYVDVLPPS